MTVTTLGDNSTLIVHQGDATIENLLNSEVVNVNIKIYKGNLTIPLYIASALKRKVYNGDTIINNENQAAASPSPR